VIRRTHLWLLASLGLACSSPSATPPTDASTGGGESSASSSTGELASSTTTRETTTSEALTETSSSTGHAGPPDNVPPGYLNPPDSGSSSECSQWLEDCPAGEKCMPYANDGGNAPNAMRCSPIAANPGQPGDPCPMEGSPVSGIDDCDLHSLCWDVENDTLEGTCVAMCIGTEGAPACGNADRVCSIDGSGLYSLCLPACDPLMQDCGPLRGCYPAASAFVCAPDASGDGGGPFMGCEFINACDAGTMCSQSPECEADVQACCVPYCSLSSPDCPVTTTCIPVFQPGDAPIGMTDVGFCGGTP
jgi:hypothetical protein